jgi:hypothetical protein
MQSDVSVACITCLKIPVGTFEEKHSVFMINYASFKNQLRGKYCAIYVQYLIIELPVLLKYLAYWLSFKALLIIVQMWTNICEISSQR